jgi:hypothetical protein
VWQRVRHAPEIGIGWIVAFIGCCNRKPRMTKRSSKRFAQGIKRVGKLRENPRRWFL